ncbi:MAG: discoidin domain-containing protein [Verrucomicrobiales bacterium]|nr:discoidin domain-containing protein [Verrucomicrobiales bacterium]
MRKMLNGLATAASVCNSRQRAPIFLVLSLLLLAAERSNGQSQPPQPTTVNDRLWAWAHDAGVYNGNWGLPGPSRMTPVEGAAYLGTKNVIFIRYLGKPAPPFDQYVIPFRSMSRVMWSITGANGITSTEEREAVFRLVAANPNITGVFMDDFFHLAAESSASPQWLAKNEPPFPVELNLELPQARKLTRVDLQQTEWRTGDYRSKDFTVATSIDGATWVEAGGGRMPNEAGAAHSVTLPGNPTRFLRFRFLNTHDSGIKSSRSCGLRALRLWSDAVEVDLKTAKIEASSTFPGHEPSLLIDPSSPSVASAALSPAALQAIRQRLRLPDRRLDLGVTLYTYQLTPRVQSHLELCDIVSLWTWKSEDLAQLETNFARLRELAPHQRVFLGCYLYDFGNNRALPLDRMKHQCALALRWLQEGKIEGIIFLGTNVCDLNLETVEWTRSWIAQVGSQLLTQGR